MQFPVRQSRWALCAAVAAATLLITGCAALFDHQPPSPSGTLRFSAITPTSVTVSWTGATDGYTAGSGLLYQLYMSTNPYAVDTLSDIGGRTAGPPVASGNITTANITNLTPGTEYYFNVVVQDSTHNATAYNSAGLLYAQSSMTGTSAPVTYDMSSGGTLALNLSVSSGTTAYAILTNAGTAANSPAAVSSSVSGLNAVAGAMPFARSASNPAATLAGHAVPAQVSGFLRHPSPLVEGGARSLLGPPPAPQPSYSVGSTKTFSDENGNAISATLQVQNGPTAGRSTLNVWVDNNDWTSGTAPSGSAMMDATRAQAVADEFLSNTSTSDIYDWETNIYGQPWGADASQKYSNLIGDDKAINILFTDMGGSSGSFVVGFFYARDNYTRTAGTGTPTDFSNQMIMFYMNSYAYSQTAAGGQMLIFSTLAHEFQHMIHFYQKTVLRAGGLGTDTWINEMMSMMTEDILADKIGTTAAAAPRGIAGSTLSYDAGSSGNTYGRLPAFDAFDDISLSNWGAVDTLASYAVAYSFGAYLERNYGGATLLHDMMYNSYTDARAVTQGVLAASGQSVSIETLLTRWAVSVLLSTSTAPAFYQYNLSSALPFSSNYGIYSSEAYSLGSINMFNYSWGSNNGPYIYPATSTMIQPPSGSQDAYSNQYVELGPVSGPTTFTKYFTVGDNNSVTIVVK